MAPNEGSATAHPEQGLLRLLAHDLRTPLGPLGLAVSSVAEAEAAPASVRELGTMAQAQGSRLARLIDATLAASGRLPYLRMRRVRVAALLDDASARFSALGGTVTRTVADGDLECDSDRIRDALVGLMEVAAGEGGSCTLQAKTDGATMLFVIPVRDPAACRGALHAPFVSSAESAFVLGARAVLRGHGGELELHGDAFTAVLPSEVAVGDEFDPGW